MRGDEEIGCCVCAKVTPHRWRPSPEAGPHWRCSECGNAGAPPLLDQSTARAEAAEARELAWREAAEGTESYTAHDPQCAREKWRWGGPAGTEWRPDQPHPCTCGLDNALALLAHARSLGRSGG